MASMVRILILRHGDVQEQYVRKGPAPRRVKALLGRCAAAALGYRVKVFAVRFSGQWRIQGVDHPDPITTVPSEVAAAMWLQHMGDREEFRW